FRRRDPVLRQTLFSTDDQPGQLAIRVLHTSESKESAPGTGAGREGRTAGLRGRNRHERSLFSRLARQRGALRGLSAGHQPAGERTTLTRFDATALCPPTTQD